MTAVANSIILQIIKGIPSAPLDPNSAESPMESLDLLDSTGIALLTEGWSPQIAPLKNGGLWVDSATMDGRQLLSDNVGNVTETMQVTCASQYIPNRLAILKKLGRLARMARAFHSGTWQIDPVYLKWQSSCTELDQYALLFNIDWSINGDTFDPTMAWDVTLTLEREPYWRALWPGANPIEWHFQNQGKTRGVVAVNNGYTYADMSLQQKSDHFKFGNCQNRTEIGAITNKVFLSGNWIDIDTIPGDAPALICASFRVSSVISATSPQRVMMAQTLNPTSIEAREAVTPFAVGDNIPAFLTLNFADEAGGVMTKASDACGVIGNNSNTTEYIETYTHPAGPATTFTMRASWPLGNIPVKQMNLWRGTLMAFMRCKQTNGSANDIRARLTIHNGQFAAIQTDEVGIPIRTEGASCVNAWALVYMGQFRLPFDKNAFSSPDGRGLFGGADNFEIELETRNTTAATKTLEFLDIVFLPIDLACAIFDRTQDSTAGSELDATTVIFDNTGYVSHGQIGDYVIANNTASDLSAAISYDNPQKLTGVIPKLIPGVNNRLYMLLSLWSTSLSLEYSAPESTTQLRLNIVPRWASVRDI